MKNEANQIENETLSIHFNRRDISKVIRLLDKNNLFYVLPNDYFDEKGKLEYIQIYQDDDFQKAFNLYLSLLPIKRKRQFAVGNKLSMLNEIVPRSAMRNHLRQRRSFKSDTRGIDIALDETIERMIENQFIERSSKDCYKLNHHSGPIV